MYHSTENKPIRFFRYFYESDRIDNLKASFYPDLTDEYHPWHSFPMTIDKDNEFYTVEFQEITNYADNSDVWFPNYQWQLRTYTFVDYLDDILKREYLYSKDLIVRFINKQPNGYKVKYFIDKSINMCLKHRRIAKSTLPYNKYAVCVKPMEAIIKYLYRNFRNIAPKANGEVKDVLQGSKEHELLYIPNKLKEGIARQTFCLRDPNTTERIFSDEIIDNEDIQAFKYVLQADFSALKRPFWVKKNAMAFHYLLYELSIRSNAPKPAIIERSNKIKVGKKYFIADRNHTYHHRYKIRKYSLKSIIDQLISDNLV